MTSLQQVVEQLAQQGTAAGTNATADANATSSAASSSQGPLQSLSSLTQMYFSASALRDWAMFLVLGSLFEIARRLLSLLWGWLINSFFLTAVFDEGDTSYQWVMLWLSNQPSWKAARKVEICTANFGIFSSVAQFSDQNDDPVNSSKLIYLPALSESYTLWRNYRWMRVTRASVTYRNGWSDRDTLTLDILTWDRHVLTEILREAKKQYLEARKATVTVYVPDSNNSWRDLATRPKRPLNSIILDPGIMELVVEDARSFLGSKSWYSERGIPFRRGYLLYGAPGSGKTSLIHSVAGELGLDVYIISLSRSGLDDIGLSELICTLPEKCIALMEDIDAAFHHGLNRESTKPPSSQSPPEPENSDGPKTGPLAPTGNRITLSGLLNALDGIGAQEGRILFATTNNRSSLDPALCRPGRMDLHIKFQLASKYQAEELFKCFYAPPLSALTAAVEKAEQGGKTDIGSVDLELDDSSLNDLIDLSSSSAPPSPSTSEISEKTDPTSPTYIGISHRARVPKLSTKQRGQLAKEFAVAVPERQLSMASLQGFLMRHKVRPFEAVTEAVAWVEKELSEKKEKSDTTNK
ncbi:P-loop containing nucleoside triphosphate hydrolase protein [Gyrodon lividus]|nr:P-loop containing nucleoside triphosphate hydrolase protein [Gyrodon lividus]